MKKSVLACLFAISGALASNALAQEVTLHKVSAEGVGEAIGTVDIEQTKYGLLFTPKPNGLTPGVHGFHVHANGSCEPGVSEGKTVAAGAAGGHLDPQKTGKHLGPYGEGHLGDLPAIYVDEKGNADYSVLAPRLKSLDEIKGKALMVHIGGDNHADHPQPLGGGGGRYACGVI